MMEIGVSTSVETEETVMDNTNTTHSDGDLEAKHKVFLSHSGMQKDFVEQLCIDLERSDRYPFFDKQRSSLPIGVKFPPLIFDAIRQCQVGVLILSKEFFTRTKWPMLELVAMVRELGMEELNSSINLIPVFYNLSQEEWLDQENRLEWILLWEEWASEDRRISIEEWKMALDALKSINSLMMKDGEVSLRREIVSAVCKLVLPETRWDDFHVQGRSRLCEILTKKIRERKQRSGIQVMGIYGIGGIGKTTICKVMCNELFQKFRGKVCHVELTSASEVELLREVLKTFTNIQHKLLVGLTMDKCRDKLKRFIVKDPIFLAIDNLSDSQEARKQAKTFLETKWEQGSVVIVTARSLGALTSLNQYIHGGECIEMPELNEDEATSLFWNHVTSRQNATIGIEKGLVSRCVDRCHFSKGEGMGRHYIPLALEVLGEQLGCLGHNPDLWEEQLKNVDAFGQELLRDKHPIFSILRTSYDSLSEDAQMLFMDAALFLPSHHFHKANIYKWNLYDWLSMMHGSSVGAMMRQLEGLNKRSLLENLGDGQTEMVMHDLWREFCVAEATVENFEDGRCLFLEEESSKLAETSPGPGSCWKNMKRMCFLNEGWRSLIGVQLDHFVNLLVLKVETGPCILLGSLLELDLKGLKHLKSLEMKTRTLQTKCTGLGSLSNLVYLRWINYETPPPDIEEIGRLTKLQVLYLQGFYGNKLPDLSMLTSLRLVDFEPCSKDMTVTGLSSKLTNIQYLNLRSCWKLQECPGLGELYALEELRLEFCYELKEVPCLRLLARLRFLSIGDCVLLRAVPGLSDLVALEEFWASGCHRLEILPDLRKLSKLRVLKCGSCRALKSLTCTRPLRALKQINLRLCSSLEELPDLSNFIQLKWLWLGGCTGLMRLTNIAPLPALLVLDLEGCSKLSALPDHLNSSVDLRELRLQKSGIVLHEDNIRELQASCKPGLVVFPGSAWSKYGIVEPGCSTVSGSDARETEVDDMEINVQNQCRSRRLPDSLPRDKVRRLTYTNAGGSLLALTSTGMHKLWNWGCELNDPRYQATVSTAPRLWRPASGMLMINEINETDLEEAVPSLAISNNDFLLTSASGGSVSVFDIRTFEVIKTIMHPPPAPTSLAYYPHDNDIKAIGMEDSTIQIVNTFENVVVCTLAGHQRRIIGLAFSKSSTNSRSVLVSLGADAQLCLWKTEKWSKRQSKFGRLQPEWRTPCLGDIRVQFHRDQRHVLVVDKSQLTVYDTSNLDCSIVQWVPEHPFTTPITDATFSCDGQNAYASFADGSICELRAYDLQPGRRLAPPIHTPQGVSGSTAYPLAIAAHPRKPGQFALGMSDGSVIVVEPLRVRADERRIITLTNRTKRIGMNEQSVPSRPLSADNESVSALEELVPGAELKAGAMVICPGDCELVPETFGKFADVHLQESTRGNSFTFPGWDGLLKETLEEK